MRWRCCGYAGVPCLMANRSICTRMGTGGRPIPCALPTWWPRVGCCPALSTHTPHPGAAQPGDPLDEELLRADLAEHVAAGVAMIRAPGLAGDPPPWFGQDPDSPRAVHAGRWIAQHGQFFDGWARRVDHIELPVVAAEQAARTGWAKLIGDWGVDDTPLPVDVVSRVVTAVHAVGGRVAVHSQHPAGGAAAVQAGVDSLEHGMCLDPALLARMASQETALTPTLSAISGSLDEVRRRPDSARKRWYLAGAEAHGSLSAGGGRSRCDAAGGYRLPAPWSGRCRSMGTRLRGSEPARGPGCGVLDSAHVPRAARVGARWAGRRRRL